MKKQIIASGLCVLALTLTLVACSPQPTGTPTVTPQMTPTVSVEPTPTPSATPIPEELKNKLVLVNPRTFSGAEYLPATNREDGTYLYRTRINDGKTMIINQSMANVNEDEFATDEQYLYYFTENLAFNVGENIQMAEADDFTKKFGLIVYRIGFDTTVSGEKRTFTGLIFKNDSYTFAFTCDTLTEKFEEEKELFEDILSGLDLMELE